MKKIKNYIIISLVKFIRTFQKKNNKFDPTSPKILIVSTTALGDSLWTTPCVETIKKNYPKAFIGVLCSNISYAIFKNNPFVDMLFLFKKPYLLNFIPTLLKLKKHKFQATLIMHSSQRLTIPLTYLLNSSILAGSTKINKGLDILFTHKIEKKNIHEIERRFEILKVIGIDERSKKTFQLLYSPKKDKVFENELNKEINNYKNTNGKKYLVVFHPGASEKFRSWSTENYIKLGNLLQNYEDLDISIAITGNANEKDLVLEIANKLNTKKTVSFPGNISLEQLGLLYKKADIVITGDTGPLHLSLSQKTKTIGLFVPTDPKLFGPYKTPYGFIIKKEPTTCKICRKKKCLDPICFNIITPEEVFNKCLSILKLP